MLETKPFLHLSTGNLLREAIQQRSPLGVEAQSYVDAGKLVPDSVVIGLVRESIEKNKNSRFIFDGFPRTIVQAEALEKQIDEIGAIEIQKALFLEVPQDSLLQRLSGRRVCKNCGAVFHEENNPTKKPGVCNACGGEVYQRKDDAAEAIQTRLEAYEKSTAPLKEYYIKKGLFVSIDGVGSSQSVFGRIQTYL